MEMVISAKIVESILAKITKTQRILGESLEKNECLLITSPMPYYSYSLDSFIIEGISPRSIE
jgi:hypothetical protein